MSLATLDEQVLGEILCFCDVQSVLRFSQVNKYCQHIAWSKHVWISLIRDLEFRGLRDRDPQLDVSASPTQTLVEMAKSVVLGPRTWSPGSSVSPTLLREVVVQLHGSERSDDASIQLLPGGTHFTVYQGMGSFSLWAVSTGRCIWGYETPHWLPCSVDIRDGGELIVFAFRTLGQPRYIEVVEVDLKTGDSFMALRLPSSPSYLNLSGDFLLPSTYWEIMNEVQVINWRANTRIRLALPTNIIDAAAATIVADNLLLVHRADRGIQLAVHALDSSAWHPDPSPAMQAPTASLIIPCSHLDAITTTQLTVHKHPTRKDAYRVVLDVFLRVGYRIPPPPPPRRIPKSFFARLWSYVRVRLQKPKPNPPATHMVDNIWRIRYIVSLSRAPLSTGGAPELTLLSTIPNFDQRVLGLPGYFIEVHGDNAGPDTEWVLLFDGFSTRDDIGILRSPESHRGPRSQRRQVMQWHRPNARFSAWPFLAEYTSAVVLPEERAMRILYYE